MGELLGNRAPASQGGVVIDKRPENIQNLVSMWSGQPTPQTPAQPTTSAPRLDGEWGRFFSVMNMLKERDMMKDKDGNDISAILANISKFMGR